MEGLRTFDSSDPRLIIMIVQRESLDVLEKAGVPAGQARAIELKDEIRRCFGSIGRQFIAATAAQTVLVVGYAYLFVTTMH